MQMSLITSPFSSCNLQPLPPPPPGGHAFDPEGSSLLNDTPVTPRANASSAPPHDPPFPALPPRHAQAPAPEHNENILISSCQGTPPSLWRGQAILLAR